MAFATVTGRADAAWSALSIGVGAAVTLPPGIVAGELLLVIWVSRSSVGPPTSVTPSAGWTQVGAINTQSATSSAVFTKTAAGGDTLTVTGAGGGEPHGATIAFRIANGGTVYSATSKITTAIDPPSLTIGAAADTLWITAVTGYRSSVTMFSATAAPTSFTDLTNRSQTVFSGTTGDVGIASAERSVNAATVDPSTFTMPGGNAFSTAWTLAISYAGGAGPSGRPKAYVAGSFQKKPGKVWTGAAWVEKPWSTWTGSTWKTLT